MDRDNKTSSTTTKYGTQHHINKLIYLEHIHINEVRFCKRKYNSENG